MEAIKITVIGNQAHSIGSPVLTSGTVGQPVEFMFDEAWEGLTKTAVFRVGGLTKDVVDIDDECTVPWEVLEKVGCCLYVGVYGTNADGSKVIPTVWAKLDPILPGADPSGDESTAPTLPVWEQISKAAVKTVNGVAPDGDGNVDVNTGEGLHRILTFKSGHEPNFVPSNLPLSFTTGHVARDAFSSEPHVGDWVLHQDALYKITAVNESASDWVPSVYYEFVVNLGELGNLKGIAITVNGVSPDENGNVELTELGNISAALDSIIAMQESMLGGESA